MSKIHLNPVNESLTLENISEANSGEVKEMFEALSQDGKKLSSLVIKSSVITYDLQEVIGKFLATNSGLTNLEISFCDDKIVPFFSKYISNHTLKSFIVSGMQLSAETTKVLSDNIRESKNLESLSVVSCKIQDHEVLFKALQQNSAITSLNLSWNFSNGFGNKPTKCLKELLEENKILTELHLTNNYLDDTALRYISDGLQNNSTLKTLCLDSNQIGRNEVKYISDILASPKLEYLSLFENSVTLDGIEEISRSLEHNTTLKNLGISPVEQNLIFIDSYQSAWEKYIEPVLKANRSKADDVKKDAEKVEAIEFGVILACNEALAEAQLELVIIGAPTLESSDQ